MTLDAPIAGSRPGPGVPSSLPAAELGVLLVPSVAGKPGFGAALTGVAGVTVMVTLLVRSRLILAHDSGQTVMCTLPSAISAVALVVLFALSRAGRDTR
jgi:hypothetical protein